MCLIRPGLLWKSGIGDLKVFKRSVLSHCDARRQAYKLINIFGGVWVLSFWPFQALQA